MIFENAKNTCHHIIFMNSKQTKFLLEILLKEHTLTGSHSDTLKTNSLLPHHNTKTHAFRS